MNILFFGSSEYSLSILQSLHNNLKVCAIITKPDKPVGRKQIRTPSPNKVFCQQNNIPVFTPADKSELLGLRKELVSLQPDLAVVSDYGLILPKEIFEIPKYKAINIHFSKLPKLRGASPVQHTILLGEKSAWITILLMNEGLDTGDIIWQKEVLGIENETTGSLYKKLFNIAAIELPNVINKYVQKEFKPQPQDDTQATYTKLISKKDSYIPHSIFASIIKGKGPVEKVARAVRAYNPWPIVWTDLKINGQKKKLKIWQGHINKDVFVPEIVQLEGKNPVPWKQFQQAYRIK